MALSITPQAIASDLLTGGSLLSQLGNVDIVAVLNQQTMKQVFKGARPVEARVRESARVMDYPVETGAILSDHKVANPTEIEMMFIINSDNYNSAYQEMRSAWVNALLLSVQTKTGTYKNLIIEALPHEEKGEMFNAVTMAIRFREVIFVAPSSLSQTSTAQNYQPLAPQNQPVVNRGLLTAVTAVGSAASYSRAFKLLRL